jgi:hypothetical protein
MWLVDVNTWKKCILFTGKWLLTQLCGLHNGYVDYIKAIWLTHYASYGTTILTVLINQQNKGFSLNITLQTQNVSVFSE